MGRERRMFDAFLAPGGIIMLLLFVLPLGLVVALSLGTTDIVGRPQFGFSWENYRQVLQPFYLPTLVRTVVFATIATVVCLALGYPFAYFATQFVGRWGGVLVAAIVLTWLVDYLVRIFAWTTILAEDGVVNDALAALGFGRAHLLGTNAAVVVGLVYSYLPLMLLPLVATLNDLDRTLVEAGKDLYGSPRATFVHVTLPATWPGIAAGVLLVFLPALGDFATAQFLGGAQSTMIGSLITQQLTASGSATVGAALTVALLLMLAIGLLAAATFARRGLDRATGQVQS